MGLENAAEDMRAMAAFLKEFFPGAGFCLLTFNFYEPSMCNYISNANREDAIKCLRETADRLEKGTMYPTPESN
jgi:hypothetical protein